MALTENPLTIVLAVILGVTASVVFGIVNVEVLSTNLKPFAPWIFVLTLVGAYMISERQMGDLDNIEVLAFVVGIGGFGLIEFVPKVATFISENQPISGIALTLVTLGAFYVLTLEDM